MNELERRVREAFDTQQVPTSVRERTLRAIEEARAAERERLAAASGEEMVGAAVGRADARGRVAVVPGGEIDEAAAQNPSTPLVAQAFPDGEVGGAAAPDAFDSAVLTPLGNGTAISGNEDSLSAGSTDGEGAPKSPPHAAPRRIYFPLKRGERDAKVASTAPSARIRSRRRRATAALAACLILVLAGFGLFSWLKAPAAYVGIDVNPSLELAVDRFGVVVGTEAFNEDGQQLLENATLNGQTYEEALSELLTSEGFSAYAAEDAFVDISVVSDDRDFAQALIGQTDRVLETATTCEHACQIADGSTRDAAHEAGLGVGRYQAACELMELDSSVTMDECASMSMRQLRDRIDACHHAANVNGTAPAAEGTDDEKSSHRGGEGSGSGQHEGTGEHGHGKNAGRKANES